MNAVTSTAAHAPRPTPAARSAARRAARPVPANSIARSGKLPLYVQCASLLRSRLDGGEWALGQCLPSLNSLSKELGVALVTVRQAMSMLENEGLLARRQGLGTFVIGRTAGKDWLRLGATWDALLGSLQQVEVQVINTRRSHLQPRLEADEGRAAANYRFVSRQHRRDKRPFCLINLYLDETIHQLDPQRFEHQLMLPVMTELAAHRIARAWQTLRVGKADPLVAAQLAIDVGDPVAHVRRLVADHEGTVLYLAEITYRGDVVRIEMNLIDAATPTMRGEA